MNTSVGRWTIGWLWACLILLLALKPCISMADTLTTHDGRQFVGKLVAKTDSVVVFEVGTPPLTAQKVFMADEVKEVLIDPTTVPKAAAPVVNQATPEKPASTDAPSDSGSKSQEAAKAEEPVQKVPTYITIPIRGTFGREIKKAVVERALQEAKRSKADVVVLEITSGGGRVSELFELLDLSVQWQEKESLPLVALVKEEAYSAAAIFAMSCKKVYMMRGSAMGAAMAINTGGKEITAVHEKFSSAIRGKARTGCEAAGHNPLIIEAMMDPDFAGLCLAKDKDGKTLLLRGEPKDYETQAERFSEPPRVFLAKNKLLTLTPGEAVECGAINGELRSFDDLAKELGYEKWASAGKSAERMVTIYEREIERNLKRYKDMVDKVEQGIGVIQRTSGYALMDLETTIRAVRTIIGQIEELAEKYDYIASEVHRDFPEGRLYELKSQCDRAIGEIRTLRRLR